MKKIFALIILFSTIVYSQIPPQGISHRGTVYNTLGALVANASVKIRISILDNNPGTVVFSETHTVTTNAQGQYSLNIGTSPVLNSPNVAFNTIDWGLNLKFLKVEIDPSGVGNNYPIVGTNQLMSVPYALYSGKSNSDVKTVNNINDLRALTGYVNNQMVFVKGYYSEGDGGDGFFIYKAAETIVDKGGIFIKPNGINPVTSP